MSKEIDEIVERARKSGVSMAEVCRKAGIAQSTPSRVRQGLWEPKPRTVRRLTEALEALVGSPAQAEPCPAAGE